MRKIIGGFLLVIAVVGVISIISEIPTVNAQIVPGCKTGDILHTLYCWREPPQWSCKLLDPCDELCAYEPVQ